MLPRRAGLVLSIAAVLGACSGAGRGEGPLPEEASLRPYDFRGHTALKLQRLCRGADARSGHAAAVAWLRCARAGLHWYLLASLREDRELLAGLAAHLGLAWPAGRSVPESLGPRLLTALAERFQRARKQGIGTATERRATVGERLVLLQRDQSRAWGADYLAGLAEAARPGAPFELEARVIIAGAALDGLRSVARAGVADRTRILLRGLGFPCPVEAAAFPGSAADSEEGLAPTCPLACPELRDRVHALPPAERKALIAAQCPLPYLGLSQRGQGVYLSAETLLVARTVAYHLDNARRLAESTGSGLAEALTGPVDQLRRRLAALRVPLALPDMSPSEPRHLQVPLCASADEPQTAGIYVALDETRFLGGPVPVLGLVRQRVELLDQVEGYTFPGQPVIVEPGLPLASTLGRLREAWSRMTNGSLPEAANRVAVYADGTVSAGRLNDLLDLLSGAGVQEVELVLRSDQGRLSTLRVQLAAERREAGPPPERGPSAPVRAEAAPLELELEHGQAVLRARVGPLHAEPYRSAVSDLSGLRERLEKTRRAYRDVKAIRVRFRGELRYHEIVRLLQQVRRNASGRPLYTEIIL